MRDLVSPSDFVILGVPIDKAAPKGRLILPQQQTIRDLLDGNAVSVVVKETELGQTLGQLGKKPALVITDSQAFGQVSRDVPEDILLTSFSILFARYKGNLESAVKGVTALDLSLIHIYQLCHGEDFYVHLWIRGGTPNVEKTGCLLF